MTRIAVLSDIHFGYKAQNKTSYSERCTLDGTLSSGKANVVRLMEAFNGVTELILLGDIFDLQLSSYSQSLESSQFFFDALSDLGLKNITYIPGNHDHAMWYHHVIHSKVILELGKDPPSIPSPDFKFSKPMFPSDSERDEPTFLQGLLKKKSTELQFRITYPWLAREIGDKKYLFLHGHFLEPAQKLIKNIIALGFLPSAKKRLPLTIDQLELYTGPQYLLFTALAQSEDGRTQLHSNYDQLSSAFQTNDIDIFDNELLMHIRGYGEQWPSESNHMLSVLDYIVYGHTHSPGVSNIRWPEAKKAVKFNTGTWLQRETEENKVLGTYIIIDDSAGNTPTLYTLSSDNGASPTEHIHMSELKNGKRPGLIDEPAFLMKFLTSMGNVAKALVIKAVPGDIGEQKK